MSKFLVIILFSTSVFAQNIPAIINDETEANFLEGRHGIELKLGIYDDTNITSITEINSLNQFITTNSSIGIMASIAYQYWFKNYLSFRLGAGALVTNTNTKTSAGEEVSAETATVVPVLTGINFYPLQIENGSNVLLYISGYVGPYIGVYTKSEVLSTSIKNETIVETVIGGRLGAGIDFFIGNIFKLGFTAGYHFMGDFSRPIGSETNYSGPEYSLVFGFVF